VVSLADRTHPLLQSTKHVGRLRGCGVQLLSSRASYLCEYTKAVQQPHGCRCRELSDTLQAHNFVLYLSLRVGIQKRFRCVVIEEMRPETCSYLRAISR